MQASKQKNNMALKHNDDPKLQTHYALAQALLHPIYNLQHVQHT